MAIYQLFEQEKKEAQPEPVDFLEKEQRSQLFSKVATRFCFLLLMLADLLWFVGNVALVALSSISCLLTFGKNRLCCKLLAKHLLHLRRSALCGVSLFIGLFSPPFGIMVACTYFLMYDKAGMEEVVPVTLQAQFKEIFNMGR